MTTPTQRHVPQFVERNLFLAALMGLYATGKRVERWTVEQAALGSALSGPRLPRDATFLAFLLGAVSLQRSVERIVGAFLDDASEAPSQVTPAEPPCLRSLLQ